MDIEFLTEEVNWRVAAQPYRASKAVPEWWRGLPRDLMPKPGVSEFPGGTIKQCSPVFDIIHAGYIIPLPFDLHVQSEGDQINFNWRWAPGTYVEGHSIEQVPIYGGAWKLINPWIIKTPPGTSVIITHPHHRVELPYRALDAIVDTDTYHNQVNFPFIWTGGDYEGVIRAGTPFVQVIPFRREQWTMKTGVIQEEDAKNVGVIRGRVNAHEHEYRKNHHKPKRYEVSA